MGNRIIIAIFVSSSIAVVLTSAYYLLEELWWRLRLRLRTRKSEFLDAVSIPLDTINENGIKHATEALDNRVRTMVSNKVRRLRTITMSTDKDGNCYITVWYKRGKIGDIS